MCFVLLFKLIVLVTLFNCFKCESSSSSASEESPETVNTLDECKKTERPVLKWIKKNRYQNVEVHMLPVDVIHLTIEHRHVPDYFESFQFYSISEYGRNEGNDDLVEQEYMKCKPSRKYCIYNKVLSYNSDDISYGLQINYMTSMSVHKTIFSIANPTNNGQGSSINALPKSVVHKVVYTVDWDSGCDYCTIKVEENIIAPPVTDKTIPVSTSSSSSSTPVVTETIDSNNQAHQGSTSSSGVTGSSDSNTQGTINIQIIIGIVALLLIITLLVMWVCYKYRNKMKAEPIYNEIQYAELLLNEVNGTPPQVNNVTYSQVRGVLLPQNPNVMSSRKDNEANSHPNTLNTDGNHNPGFDASIQDNAEYSEVKDRLATNNANNEIETINNNESKNRANDEPYAEVQNNLILGETADDGGIVKTNLQNSFAIGGKSRQTNDVPYTRIKDSLVPEEIIESGEIFWGRNGPESSGNVAKYCEVRPVNRKRNGNYAKGRRLPSLPNSEKL